MFKRESLTIIEVEAAFCMWEHILDNIPHYQPYLDGHGYAAPRHCSMQAGLIAHEVYELLTAQGHEYCTSYDWEFSSPRMGRRPQTCSPAAGAPAMTTIHFNTCRLYCRHGQRITVQVQQDGTVLFMDHSRGIGGKLNEKHRPLTMEVRHLVDWMIVQYDLHEYTTSAEAMNLTWDPAEEHQFRI